MSDEAYNFRPGRRLAGKYEVIRQLGIGWEGEVYHVRELTTGIDRAAKFYYPRRNPRGKLAVRYARKLTKLRHCPIITQYLHQDSITHRGQRISFLVSEYFDGQMLSAFLQAQPGKRLGWFEALHLLHTLAAGVEPIHACGEYHGDIHSDNIMLRRSGIGFEVKLVDFFDMGPTSRSKIRRDVIDLVQVFFETLGGRRYYAKQPRTIKQIICGLKHGLILSKFSTAGQLRRYLEKLQWT